MFSVYDRHRGRICTDRKKAELNGSTLNVGLPLFTFDSYRPSEPPCFSLLYCNHRAYFLPRSFLVQTFQTSSGYCHYSQRKDEPRFPDELIRRPSAVMNLSSRLVSPDYVGYWGPVTATLDWCEVWCKRFNSSSPVVANCGILSGELPVYSLYCGVGQHLIQHRHSWPRFTWN